VSEWKPKILKEGGSLTKEMVRLLFSRTLRGLGPEWGRVMATRNRCRRFSASSKSSALVGSHVFNL